MENNYFIRLSDNKDFFIHFQSFIKTSNGVATDIIYKVSRGFLGACIWKKKEAEAFIKSSGKQNLELIEVTSVTNATHI